jgi:translation initiation factor 6
MLRLGNINGSQYVGVYCVASERFALVPEIVEARVRKDVGRTLDVEVVPTHIGGSTIIGSLAVMNSNGVVVSNFVERSELRRLPKELRVGVMEEKLNAAGNNILANDHGAYVHPDASNHTVRMLEEVLGVEVQRRAVAGVDIVGSTCIATDKGVLCHPRTTEDELKDISGFFKVPAAVATLNYGTPFLGACAIANSKGAYVGTKSTPIELGRLEDGLGLY